MLLLGDVEKFVVIVGIGCCRFDSEKIALNQFVNMFGNLQSITRPGKTAISVCEPDGLFCSAWVAESEFASFWVISCGEEDCSEEHPPNKILAAALVPTKAASRKKFLLFIGVVSGEFVFMTSPFVVQLCYLGGCEYS